MRPVSLLAELLLGEVVRVSRNQLLLGVWPLRTSRARPRRGRQHGGSDEKAYSSAAPAKERAVYNLIVNTVTAQVSVAAALRE